MSRAHLSNWIAASKSRTMLFDSCSSWSIPDPPQDMRSLSLLRNCVDPECHLSKLATPSNPKITIQFRAGIVSLSLQDSGVFKILDFFLEKITASCPQGNATPGPRAGPALASIRAPKTFPK